MSTRISALGRRPENLMPWGAELSTKRGLRRLTTTLRSQVNMVILLPALHFSINL